MYTLADYGRMLDDRIRVDAYAAALRGAVRPGDVVVEIGTGLGTFALLCCELGARKVVAIEPDAVIAVARSIVDASPFADRIHLVEASSTDVVVDERADVIVSDLRGVLPLYGRHIPAIIDARARMLRPGGRLLPLRDTLWASPVEAPDAYRGLAGVFDDNAFGHDMTAARDLAVHAWTRARLGPEALLGAPAQWGRLDYASIDSPDISGTVEIPVERAAVAHGVLLWFDATIAEGIGYSNAPRPLDEPTAVYQSAFFSWVHPVPVETGDVVGIDLRADLVAGEYVWTWKTSIAHTDGRRTRFDQSTFFGIPISRKRLASRGAQAIVSLPQSAQIDAFVLAQLDGRRTNGEVAALLLERFPSQFASLGEATARVGNLVLRYLR